MSYIYLIMQQNQILKKATGVDISHIAKETDSADLKLNADKLNINNLKMLPSNLSNLKSKANELDIGKLESTPADLSKLKNVVKNKVVKKTEYDEMAWKNNNINTTDTSDLVKKNLI